MKTEVREEREGRSEGRRGATVQATALCALRLRWVVRPGIRICLEKVGAAANTEDGQKAVQLDLAEQAITAKEAIARESSVVLLSDSHTSPANVVL